MRILDRYIIWETVKIVAGAVCVFVAVFVIVDLFEKLARFIEAQVAPGMVARYYVFSLPSIAFQAMPVAVLLASLLSLGTMGRHHELLAMKMAALPTLRIALPCLLVAAGISLTALGLGETLVPRASERAQDIWRTQVKKLPPYRFTRENDVWYRADGNRFLHISLMDTASGVIQGLTVFELDPDFSLRRRLDGREAAWRGDAWTLKDGFGIEILSEGEVRVDPFDQAVVALQERPPDLTRIARAPEEMSLGELRAYIRRLSQSGVNAQRYKVDLYLKLATAFVSLVMALIGIAFGVRTGKAGVLAWVGVCLGLGVVYWILLSLGVSLGRSGALPPFLAAWLPTLLFGAGGLLALWRVRT